MRLPQWLDDYIFNELGAKYQPSYSDMTNIHDDKEKTLNYLGTYFPRSYVEAYCIFSDFFENHKSEWENRKHISIFDFGCGTGGEIIGLLTVLSEKFPKIEKVRVVGLDGNGYALSILKKVFEEFKIHTCLQLECHSDEIIIDDFYDLQILDNVLRKQFDIIITFKAICEFVTKDQFERQNAYEHISRFLLPKLYENGVMLLEDVTTYNHTSQEWLPMMMDKGLKEVHCNVLLQNEGYNQTYIVSHSCKSCDVSKVAWRLITND